MENRVSTYCIIILFISILRTNVAIDCAPLNDPNNGQVDTSSGCAYGSTATYTCHTGYTLSGSQPRTCGADGNWTLTEPSCNSMFTFLHACI